MIYRISDEPLKNNGEKTNEQLKHEVEELTKKLEVLDGALQDIVAMQMDMGPMVNEGGEM